MTFEEKFKQIVAKIGLGPAKFWRNAFVLTGVILALSLGYEYLRPGNFNVYAYNRAFANTGMWLIGLSLALSGLCYFWNFVDTKVIYRKHLGVIGFLVELVHVVLSIFFLPHITSWTDYLKSQNIVAFIFAVISLVLLIFLTAISNQFAVTELGSKNWRRLLRLGYVAYLAAAIHMFLRAKDRQWGTWWNEESFNLPPHSLIILIFAVFVFGLRVALEVSQRRKVVVPVSAPAKS